MSKLTFDMPHALVTLTDVEGNVEIEVWPKAGQSAYVVVPPAIARAIADQIVRMADAAEAERTAESVADGLDPERPAITSSDHDDRTERPATNVVDLASRRRPH